jgi:hypothetical protein
MPVKSLQERFERHFKKGNQSSCWNWTGRINSYGYGTIRTSGTQNRKQLYAHRLSYSFYAGEIPEGFLVCHKCDNRLCVNPQHLFLGTHQDNCSDKIAKERHLPNTPRGSRHGMAILNDSFVLQIRKLYKTKQKTRKELAEIFCVGKHVIHSIVTYKTWRHLP